MVVYSCTQFSGQFESYLFQKGESKVVESIKRCWCSCFSERVMSHRLDCGLPTTGLKMAVVIQVHVCRVCSTADLVDVCMYMYEFLLILRAFHVRIVPVPGRV